MRRCHRCGAEWVSDKKQPAVKEVCEACSAYLHCCMNCRFRDPSLHNECAIPTTDWVGDREGCNFCDEFEFIDGEEAVSDPESAKQARSALDSLFGDGPTVKEADRLDAFKKLFGD